MGNLPAFPDFVIREVPEVGSTNLYMEELLTTETIPEGSVIYTLNQFAGIGHGENKWESEPFKNLTATIILNPTFLDAADQFYITVIASLSVADTVEHFIPDKKTQVKWPNDIYCENRKIAGILIKNHIMGSSIAVSIIGLGLNINQAAFVCAPYATSFKLLTNQEFDLKQVLSKWHSNIEFYYRHLRHEKKLLIEKYLSKMYLRGQLAEYLIGDRFVRASIDGVDRHGMLVLYDENRKKYVCGLKEIVFPFLG